MKKKCDFYIDIKPEFYANKVICSKVQKPTIVISPYAHMKVIAIFNKVSPAEWECDLLGIREDNVIRIEDIYLFEQTESYGVVVRLEAPHPKAVGVLHAQHAIVGGFTTVKESLNPDVVGTNIVGIVDRTYTYKFICVALTPCQEQTYVEVDGIIALPEIDTSKIKKFEMHGLD